MSRVQEKINLVRFHLDHKSHITIDPEKCAACTTKPCLFACPAGMFTLSEEELLYSHEGCLECGTCYVVCPKGSVDWHYPRGGFGVSFREA